MHQQIHCHTLPKPFFKIFLFRIYAPTIHSTDFELDETSVRHPQIHTPIQPTQTNPPTTQSHRYTPIRPTNQSTNDHRYTDTQIPRPHGPTNTNTTHTRRRTGPVDVDAASTLSQPLLRQQLDRPYLDRPSTGQARYQTDRALMSHTPDQDMHAQFNRPGIRQAIT